MEKENRKIIYKLQIESDILEKNDSIYSDQPFPTISPGERICVRHNGWFEIEKIGHLLVDQSDRIIWVVQVGCRHIPILDT